MDMFFCFCNGGNWFDLGNFIKSLFNLVVFVVCFFEIINKVEISIRFGIICDGFVKDCFFLD